MAAILRSSRSHLLNLFFEPYLMFPELEVCNTTKSTITEVAFSRYSGSP